MTAPDLREAVEAARRTVEAFAWAAAYKPHSNRPERDAYHAARALLYLVSKAEEGWRPIEEADKTRIGLVGAWSCSVIWTSYKRGSPQFNRGIKGRWQRAREYMGWENCDPPEMVRVLPSPPKP